MYSFGELLWRDLSIPVSSPLQEVSLLGRTVVRVAAGGFHCGALSEQGTVFMWGENTAGQCGLTDRDTDTSITGWSETFLLSYFLLSVLHRVHTLLALFTFFFPQCLHLILHSYNPLLRNRQFFGLFFFLSFVFL